MTLMATFERETIVTGNFVGTDRTVSYKAAAPSSGELAREIHLVRDGHCVVFYALAGISASRLRKTSVTSSFISLLRT